MTTIATDGETIAADGQSSYSGQRMLGPASKIMRIALDWGDDALTSQAKSGGGSGGGVDQTPGLDGVPGPVRRGPLPAFMGYAGSAGLTERVAGWVSAHPASVEVERAPKGEWAVILLTRDGDVYFCTNEMPTPHRVSPLFTAGSGEAFAQMAMVLGYSPINAVRAASLIDTGTGQPFVSYSRRELRDGYQPGITEAKRDLALQMPKKDLIVRAARAKLESLGSLGSELQSE